MALTNAEKQKRFREKQKALGFKRGWMAQRRPTAAGLAKQRLETFVAKKLQDEDDLTKWELYTWLLNQAKNHKLDYRGYASLEYQEDRKKARLKGEKNEIF
jgi:hypothetical protein